jgi:basic membrane lipoprotein Med (substrate-binding protein (PBP1-ABC) superfamily)
MRKFEGIRIPRLADFINADAAGIRQAERSARFIKRLARSVVTSFADNLIIRVAVNGNDMRMPAADYEA